MKKIYAILASAMVCTSAVAAPKTANSVVVNALDAQSMTAKTLNVKVTEARKVMTRTDAPAKAITSRDDLCGKYFMSYEYPFSGDDRFGGSMNPTIEPGSTPNEVLFVGMPYSDIEIPGFVDTDKKTITINKVFLFADDNGKQVPLQPFTVTDSGLDLAESIVFHYNDKGDIAADVYDGFFFGFKTDTGYSVYSVGCYAISFSPVVYWSFDASKYEKVSQPAIIEDACMNYQYGSQVGPQNVDLYVSKTNKNEFVIANPYAGDDWKDYNDAFANKKSAEGHLVVDITNPDCVLLRPLVLSGYWMDFGEEVADLQNVCIYNQEGYSVLLKGVDPESMIEEFGAIGLPLSTYTADSNTIDITNIFFAPQDNPLARIYWIDQEKNPIDSHIIITLPEGLGAVNDIINDVENAPKRFFNLQGIEVANPAAGELVIVKQGNKTSKTIVR